MIGTTTTSKPAKSILINLSAIAPLDLSATIKNFATLLAKYQPSMPTFLQTIEGGINVVKVASLHDENKAEIFDAYKLGQINTDEFLNRLLTLFDCLLPEKRAENGKSHPQINIDWGQDADRIQRNKANFYCTKNLENEPDDIQIAKALLEEAWNSAITLSETGRNVLASLNQKYQEERTEIIFISNSNPLNIHKILQLFQTAAMPLREALQLERSENKRIELAEGFSLAVSYNFGSYKTAGDNQDANQPITTPTLTTEVLRDLQLDETLVVSQYAKDLEAAKEGGMAPENVKNAKDYFVEINAVPQDNKGCRVM